MAATGKLKELTERDELFNTLRYTAQQKFILEYTSFEYFEYMFISCHGIIDKINNKLSAKAIFCRENILPDGRQQLVYYDTPSGQVVARSEAHKPRYVQNYKNTLDKDLRSCKDDYQLQIEKFCDNFLIEHKNMLTLLLSGKYFTKDTFMKFFNTELEKFSEELMEKYYNILIR